MACYTGLQSHSQTHVSVPMSRYVPRMGLGPSCELHAPVCLFVCPPVRYPVCLLSVLSSRLRHFQSLSSPLLNIHMFPSMVGQQQRYRDAVSIGYSQITVILPLFIPSPLPLLSSSPSLPPSPHPSPPSTHTHTCPPQGWSRVDVCDMNQFFLSLPKDECQRLLSLEMFDEFEEFHLKCGHYMLLCAFNGSCTSLSSSLSLPPSPAPTPSLQLDKEVELVFCHVTRNQWKLNRQEKRSSDIKHD